MNSENPSSFITDVKVRLVEDGTDGLLAWASCVVSGVLRVDNIAVRRSNDGSLFITYPNKLTANGGKYPYFNPISTEAANIIQDAVLVRLAVLAKAASGSGTTD